MTSYEKERSSGSPSGRATNWLPRSVAGALFALLLSAAPAQAQKVVGDWQGTLKAGAVDLRIVLHVVSGDNGTLSATMDSIDQGANGIPVTAVSLTGSTFVFSIDPIKGSYEGRINADGSIEGTWTQGGSTLPLVLRPVKNAADVALRRPQHPVRPYPYKEEEVSYDNKAAGITLAATLTIPVGAGPFPAVLLITGSGPQDRDESLMGHRPFLVLADYLTRRGIATLRADDRGVGKSSGDFGAATTADFATDAEAGVAYLRTRSEVNQRKIGLVGHSEGGVIAPIVAASNPAVAFIVLMAGSGVPGDEIIVAQSVLIAQAAGVSREQAERDGRDLRDVLTLVKREANDAVLEASLQKQLAGKLPPAQIAAQVKALTTPWYRYFIGYDPAPPLARVRCPVLAIAGEKDLQVPPKENLAAIRSALRRGGNAVVDVEELPGLNHLFQTAKTGAPSEYGQIEETMSPVALDRIARWIGQR